MTSRGCFNSLIALFLLMLACFVVGLGIQIGWAGAARQAELNNPTPAATLPPTETAEPTATATVTATAEPTVTPTMTATATRTPRPTNTPRPTVTPTLEPTTYEVQPGDTFSEIAASLGVDTDALAEANPDVDPALIRPGDVLVVPARDEETEEE